MSQAGVSRTTVKTRKAAPVIILRSIPKDFNWGWFTREDPRMHLQTVDSKHRNQYKVWLERNGKRVFEPLGNIPAKVLKALEAEVTEERVRIEAQWIEMMIQYDWLTVQLRDREVMLTAYPQFPGARFIRTFDIADHLPALYNPSSQLTGKSPVKPEEIGLNAEVAAVEVYPQKHESKRPHISLPEILWQD